MSITEFARDNDIDSLKKPIIEFEKSADYVD
jgi:hypothetical protein